MTWRFLPVSRFAEATPVWQQIQRKFGATPLLDPVFIQQLIEHFASGGELIALHEAEPMAVGILSRRGRFGWQTIQPANAPLGAWIADPNASTDTLLSSLAAALPGPALMVGLSQLDPSFAPRPEVNGRVKTLDYIKTARVPIEGSYEDYWSARSKNLKHNMKRQRNRLARDNVAIRFEEIREPDKIAEAVNDYARLESAGWKGSISSAVRVGDTQCRFYIGMLREFAVRGEAVIYRYFYNDALVATDLCLLCDKTLIILKTTHDESRKGTSPAHLMRHEVVQRAFEKGDVDCIEFYGPAQDWHLRWTDDVRVMYHLNYYRLPLISLLHGAKRKAKTS